MKIDISIIIPFKGSSDLLDNLLNHIINQTYIPSEIIIIDTNLNKEKLNLNSFSTYNIQYTHHPNLYPGEARNIGVKKSNNNLICFVDLKTTPSNSNWFKDLYQNYIKSKCDVVFGSTSYKINNKSYLSKLIISSTFGNINHQTIPGTILTKQTFYKNGEFYNKVRSGEDYEWRYRLKKKDIKYSTNYNDYLDYYPLNTNLLSLSFKYFVYSIHSARLNILINQKMFFMAVLLILSSLIIPRWNYYINNWDNNILYIPNITKIFIFVLFLFSILYYFLIILKKININKFFSNILIFIIIFYLSYSIYNYNYFIVDKFDMASFYIPHITKIYIFFLLILSILLRGVVLPIRRNVDRYFVFKNFLFIGIIGFILDISKIPGNIIGYLLMPKNFLWNRPVVFSDKRKILFICPFPIGVQAGQRLKYEQFFDIFKQNNYEITVEPFIDINTWQIIYKKGFYIQKTISLIRGYINRFKIISQLRSYDSVYIFMWVTPYGFNFFEKIYRLFSKKIIYDIEDNILIIKKNEINKLNFLFKTQYKIRYLIRSADRIVASSIVLAKECNKISNKNNAKYICASINMKRYIPNYQYKVNNTNKIVIGWTGTFTSKIYLDLLKKVFQNLSKRVDFKLIIISDFNYQLPGVNLEVIKWNKGTEIEDLSRIDIGVYPLTTDDWVSGKSGLKALQYMAMALPTVATNIGNIKNIIKNNDNGFLVDNMYQWEETLFKLINNNELRKKIGLKARETVNKSYSIESNSSKYLEVLKN